MAEKIAAKRFAELDILRGVAIAIMIIVDAPPTEIYYFFKHAAWEDLTLADMLFQDLFLRWECQLQFLSAVEHRI